MHAGKWMKKLVVIGLIICMVAGTYSFAPSTVQAAGEDEKDLEVTYGKGTVLGNATYAADNAFLNFYGNSVPGFRQTLEAGNSNIDWDRGDLFLGTDDEWSTVKFEIKIADNPVLKEMAQSGEAEVEVGWEILRYHSGIFWTRISTAQFKLDGEEILFGRTSGGNVYATKTTKVIKPDSIIEIEVVGEGNDANDGEAAGARGLFIKFKEEKRPVLNGYAFTGNGAERLNPNTGQTELYVKQTENIKLKYEFSEVVQPTALGAVNEHFLRHPLFVNPDGTGLPASGQQQYLINETYNGSNMKEYHDNVTFGYTAVKYHNSGNLPLVPKITQSSEGGALIDQNMEDKLAGAVFRDGAGNLADLSNINKSTENSNDFLDGKHVGPFDYAAGGYRVIVDAVAPKYTKSGNGVYPSILTGSTVNNKDNIDFTLQFTEEAVTRKNYDITKTFLLFNNGMKAYYVSGSGQKNWTFRLPITAGVEIETPLLKLLAVSNDQKGDNSDKDVIQDYAGNLLIQPANFIGEHEDGDISLVNSKMDWANLAIDNTKPIISFKYETGGANSQTYMKTGKVTIDASDPQIIVPVLDPIVADRGISKSSRGIYRPSNQTGSSSPSVGLIYYVWSKSAADPFLSKASDYLAAIKRYSLAAKQPSDELYPSGFAGVEIRVTNNKTNLLAPPAEALTSDGSGEWYLHSWTADMTWDTARELMQYEKKKIYVQEHASEYAAWKAEAPGSDADKTFYADNKALAAVGQYADITVWPLADFSHDDSNWAYDAAKIRLDNQKPIITFTDLSGNGSYNVTVTANVYDAHSGLNQSKTKYQWVKSGVQPKEIDWKDLTLSSGKANLQTINDLTEDGVYSLYVKAADNAGNEITTKATDTYTVDSSNKVIGSFSPNPVLTYVQSHDIGFKLKGADPSKVAYAFNTSSVRPASESSYTVLTAASGGNSTIGRDYTIPVGTDKNGIVYVHILVKEGSSYYYYSKAYYFDNKAPVVTFSKNGSAFAQDQHELTVTVSESYSTTGLVKQYQWVKDGAAAPTAGSGGWINLPGDGVVPINGASQAVGETVDYKLYILAVDGAENSAVTSTNPFKVSNTGAAAPAVDAKSDLIYLYADQFGGSTAIIKLGLDIADKRGYEYSISGDNGTSWVKWRPYTNFVSLAVPTGSAASLQVLVKYRTPAGGIGKAVALAVNGSFSQQPVYALAAVRVTSPVSAQAGADLDLTIPTGMKVTPSAVNPTVPTGSGNSYNVKENGFYSFDIVDTNNASRKDTLYVNVNNVDDTAPRGEIEYLSTAKTNGNVTVKLNASEPVVITNNSGRSTYTFTENGSFTFQFKDEAGNTGSEKATVNYIDKTAPEVKIVRSYVYGDQNELEYNRILDQNNNVLLASGVVLEVVKLNDSSKDFFAMEGQNKIVMRENGSVSFTVYDSYDNATKITEEITGIWSQGPAAEAAYSFVDDNGDELPDNQLVTIDGRKYGKGRVKVTLSGSIAAPNRVFTGVVPIKDDNDAYTNLISSNSLFSTSRYYSTNGATTIVLSDDLGNVTKVPVAVAGLDNTAPEIKLNRETVGIVQNKSNFQFQADLGGFTVKDNLSAAADIQVSISGLDLATLGRQRVAYKAVDQVGNEAVVYQDVVVVSGDGMLIFANGTLISGSSGETALFDTNNLTFTIDQFNLVKVNGVKTANEWGKFDLLYQPGLFREGQMKYIAKKVTYQQLISGQYKITFPQAGWYTVIVRNQEREREFATFFIGKMEQ